MCDISKRSSAIRPVLEKSNTIMHILRKGISTDTRTARAARRSRSVIQKNTECNVARHGPRKRRVAGSATAIQSLRILSCTSSKRSRPSDECDYVLNTATKYSARRQSPRRLREAAQRTPTNRLSETTRNNVNTQHCCQQRHCVYR